MARHCTSCGQSLAKSPAGGAGGTGLKGSMAHRTPDPTPDGGDASSPAPVAIPSKRWEPPEADPAPTTVPTPTESWPGPDRTTPIETVGRGPGTASTPPEATLGTPPDGRRRLRRAAPDPRAITTPDAEAAEEDAEDLPPRRGGVLAAVAAGLATISLLLGGLVLGYRLSNESKEPARAGTTVNLPKGRLATSDSVESVMPDVEGLSKSDALEALADAGFDPARVESQEKAWVGDPGRVVKQEPTRGAKQPDKVVIFVSTGARMPALAGKTEAEAAKLVADLGGVMERHYVYDATVATPRTVISTDPAPGGAMTQTVVARVSVEPSSRYLTDIGGEGRSCQTGSISVAGGTTAGHSLWCRTVATAGTPQSLHYLVEGRAARLHSTVGIAADAEPGSRGRLQVKVDGALVQDLTLTWGEVKPLDLDLRGKSRVDLVFTPLDPRDSDADGVAVVLQQVTIYGSPDDMAAFGQ